jgi:hypothetical protein
MRANPRGRDDQRAGEDGEGGGHGRYGAPYEHQARPGWAYRWSGQSLAAGFGLAITAPQDAAVHASELGKRALGKLLRGIIGAGSRTARMLARDRLVAGGMELGYPWG